MSEAKFEFGKLSALLARRADDPAVIDLVEDPEFIQRSSYLAYAELKDEGVSVMFNEASPNATLDEGIDLGALQVSAVHLHRKGHEGYAQYDGRLPNGITFNDREDDVLKKLGRPVEAGGGGMSTVLKRPVPRWLRYVLDNTVVHLQLDAKGRVEMVTLYPSDTKLGSMPYTAS